MSIFVQFANVYSMGLTVTAYFRQVWLSQSFTIPGDYQHQNVLGIPDTCVFNISNCRRTTVSKPCDGKGVLHCHIGLTIRYYEWSITIYQWLWAFFVLSRHFYYLFGCWIPLLTAIYRATANIIHITLLINSCIHCWSF